MNQEGPRKAARGARRRWREARITAQVREATRALGAAVKVMGHGENLLSDEARTDLEALQRHVSRLIEMHRLAHALSPEEDNDRRLRQVFRKTAGVAQVRRLVGPK